MSRTTLTGSQPRHTNQNKASPLMPRAYARYDRGHIHDSPVGIPQVQSATACRTEELYLETGTVPTDLRPALRALDRRCHTEQNDSPSHVA
jgi:hypothetical protein